MPKKKRYTQKKSRPRREDKSKGFILPYAGEENTTLGKEFIDDPKKFLRRNNLRASDLECRPEVHAAIERGEKFGEAVFELGGTATDIKIADRSWNIVPRLIDST